jgi:hypothetical protein
MKNVAIAIMLMLFAKDAYPETICTTVAPGGDVICINTETEPTIIFGPVKGPETTDDESYDVDGEDE